MVVSDSDLLITVDRIYTHLKSHLFWYFSLIFENIDIVLGCFRVLDGKMLQRTDKSSCLSFLLFHSAE